MVLITGCGSSGEVAAIPPGLDRTAVPKQTVAITARRFEYMPDVIHVPVGTLVTLEITSLDGTHGFAISGMNIDETIEEHQTKAVEFYAAVPGELKFRCSHFCGLGHLGMSGRIIVELPDTSRSAQPR